MQHGAAPRFRREPAGIGAGRNNVIIDRFRGFSVLAVVVMHSTIFLPGARKFLFVATGNGYYGVTAFFCISGFLITANLLKRYGQVAKTDLYAFYVMRFGRIVPTLALLCGLLSLLSLTTVPQFIFPAPLTLGGTLINIVTLRYNHYYLRGGSAMPVWAILWSLSIEETFYLGYPLVAKITRRTWLLLPILVGVAVYGPIHRMEDFHGIYECFGCFDAIAWGSLSAFAANRFAGRVPAWAASLLLVGGMLAIARIYLLSNVHLHAVEGVSVLAIGSAVVLFASQCERFVGTKPFSYDPLAWIGRISYESYLFHMTILGLLSNIIGPAFAWQPVGLFCAALLYIFAVSHIIGRYYAEPLNRWLRAKLLARRLQIVSASAPDAGLVTSISQPADA